MLQQNLEKLEHNNKLQQQIIVLLSPKRAMQQQRTLPAKVTKYSITW